jgi:hypothetical protein
MSNATKEYDNTNQGAIFRNEDKAEGDERDYTGNINVEGREFWVSGFVKTSKAGKKYLRLTVKPKGGDKASKRNDLGFVKVAR